MPKRKRNTGTPVRKGKQPFRSALGSDDESMYRDLADPDPASRSYVYDEIDEFHEKRDKILLNSRTDKKHLEDDESEVEEVLPLLSGDESSDDDDVYAQMARKDEIASDVEDDLDDGLPDARAWGKKKSVYYNTDYVDPDYGGFQGSDAELAENEEKEAVAIQKRMLEQLEDADFGFQWLQPIQKSGDTEKVKDHSKITVDLSRMSQSEKLEMLKMESSELLDLINDFKTYMTELNDRLSPLLPLIKDKRLTSKIGTNYILAKYQLIMMYCTNISFYMALKCKGTSIRSHPIMKRLAVYKKLLKQFEEADKKLAQEIDHILKRLEEGDELRVIKPQQEPSTKPKKHRFRILEKHLKQGEKTVEKEKVKQRKEQYETDAEREALQMYQIMKEGHKKSAESETDSSQEEDKEMNADDIANDDETEEKRQISYQIAKNKGLTPHRKKEYRNPRVRHRIKYKKAKIRRKGQVRIPRSETARYGGEISGIRSAVSRSIKLK